MITWRLLRLFILISFLTSCIPSPLEHPREDLGQRNDGSWTLSFSGALTGSFAKDPAFPEDDQITTATALKGSDREGNAFTSFQFSQRNRADDFVFRLVATERQEAGVTVQTMTVTLNTEVFQGRAVLSYDQSSDGLRLSGSIIGINLTNASGDSFSVTGFFDVPISGTGF
jgi:hypothetical protein